MFGGHWFNISGDTVHLICHFTSKDYAIEKSRDFTGSSSSFQCHLSLMALGIGDTIFLIYLIISQDNMIKESCDFILWAS